MRGEREYRKKLVILGSVRYNRKMYFPKLIDNKINPAGKLVPQLHFPRKCSNRHLGNPENVLRE